MLWLSEESNILIKQVFIDCLMIIMIVIMMIYCGDHEVSFLMQNTVLPIVSCNIFGTILNIGLNAGFVLGLKMGPRYAYIVDFLIPY